MPSVFPSLPLSGGRRLPGLFFFCSIKFSGPCSSNLSGVLRGQIRFSTLPNILVAVVVKNSPAMQETQVQSLGREAPLKKRRATHSSSLACRIPWTEEPGGLQSMGWQRVGHN